MTDAEIIAGGLQSLKAALISARLSYIAALAKSENASPK
jgi:hypothetical protein